MWDRMKELDLRRSDMKYLERTSLMDFLVMQHDIRTVGELYATSPWGSFDLMFSHSIL